MDLNLNSAAYTSLSERVSVMHERILHIAPDIDRVACALYDPLDDTLKTFLNSTREGMALRAYQYRLSDSESLSYLARTRELRLLTDLPNQLTPTSAHSQYLLSEGYLSSFTVPISQGHTFLGFVFFDSRRHETFSDTLVQRELDLHANVLAMAIANELLLVRSIVATVQVVRGLTSLRDVETGAHLERMSRFSRMITRTLGAEMGLNDEFVEQMHLFAPLHDIGKVAIPDHILLKPGRLDPDEWEVMKAHTTRGREMVDGIITDLGVDASLDITVLRNIVAYHHEYLDGSGYPEGLAGDEVPLEARIVTVADIFDALTSPRPYKDPWGADRAYAELDRMVTAGKLDGRCVDALKANHDLVLEAIRHHQDAQPGALG